MPQPDSGDNCCDCPDRTSPCDDCVTCPSVEIFLSLQPGGFFCGICTGGTELDWSVGQVVTTSFCELHTSGVFTDGYPPNFVECVHGGITDCTDATWTLDYVFHSGSNTFDLSVAITIPPCDGCCGFSHTVTVTGVPYTGTSQDLSEASMGTDCGFDIGGFGLFMNGP